MGKIAIVLHLISCVEDGVISEIISKRSIEKAALALNYFINQSISMIALTEETLESHLVRVLEKARTLGTIKVRDVQRLFSGKKRIDGTTARNYLDQLVSLGYGKINNGIFTPKDDGESHDKTVDNVDKLSISYRQADPNTSMGLDPVVDNVDKKIDLSKKEVCDTSVTKVEENKLGNKTLKRGDRVRITSTGETGTLSLWHRNRDRATVELDFDGGMSGYIPVSGLDWISD